MRFFKYIFIILFPLTIMAQVKISVNPPNPVKGEPFLIVFDCEIKGDVEPEISFDPSGLEILGRDSRGLSTRTIYSMGKLTVTREISYVYEAVANQSGKVHLNDIRIVLDNIKYNKGNLAIDVGTVRQEALPFFVSAEVENKEVYVGEGINVRYFLYTKVPISSFDIKKFPKLDGFMKRFLQENDQGERVQINGEIYRRNIIYSSRLFPEKPGRLIIDPLFFSVTFSDEQVNPFGFGFGRGDQKTREIESKPIEIKVRDLPSPKPAGFTGLVGNNDISLRASPASLMVNEPYEFKLTITGDGALENVESPKVFQDGILESFDARSDLKIMTAERAQKDISYTYIAKKPGVLSGSALTLYTFSPSRKEYISHKLTLPEIKVAGSENVKTESDKEDKPSVMADESLKSTETSPLKNVAIDSSLLYKPTLWLSFFALIALLLLLFKITPKIKKIKNINHSEFDIKFLSTGKATYGDWLRIIDYYLPGEASEIKKKIEQSHLSESSKNQLKSIFLLFENAQFSNNKNTLSPKIPNPVVRELQELKKRVVDEDN